jgi:hypothetical protein
MGLSERKGEKERKDLLPGVGASLVDLGPFTRGEGPPRDGGLPVGAGPPLRGGAYAPSGGNFPGRGLYTRGWDFGRA